MSGQATSAASLQRFVHWGIWWHTVLDTVELWRRRGRERRELLRLGDVELRDFGVSRSEAIGEANKPFWRG